MGIVLICGSSQEGMLTKNPNNTVQIKQSLPNMEEKGAEQYVDMLKKNIYQPYKLAFFSKTVVTQVACSFSHAIAVTQKGAAYCWGANTNFQLGLGYSSKHVETPIRLLGALEQKQLIQAICGDRYSAVLTNQGEVWTFGTSEWGVLGHENKNYYIIQEPRMVNDIPPMMYLSCGGQSMMAIQNEVNKLWVWGNNQYGQLGVSLQRQAQHDQGDGDDKTKQYDEAMQAHMSNIDKLKNPDNYIIYKPRIVPVRALSGEVTVGQVANGSFHTILLSEGGSLYACGLSRYAGHQVIDPEEEEEQAQMNEQDKEKFNNQRLVEFIDQFTIVTAIETRKFKMVACNESHTLALTDEGNLFTWGSAAYGKLGPAVIEELKEKKYSLKDDKHTITLPPRQVNIRNEYNHEERFLFVTCGTNHSIVISESHRTYGWGCIMGGRVGVSFKRLYEDYALEKSKSRNDKLEFEEKYCPHPKLIMTYEFEEDAMRKAEGDDQKSVKSKSMTQTQKMSNKSKTRTSVQTKPKKEAEDQDISLDDEEILDEVSLHSSSPSQSSDENDDDQEKKDKSEGGSDEENMSASIEERSPNTSQAKSLLLRHRISQVSVLKPADQSALQTSEKKKTEVKKIDPLQKGLIQQTEDCENENLYIQDQEIDNKLRITYTDIGFSALRLQTELNIVNSHLSEIIEYRAKNLASLNQSKIVQDVKFIVPYFIIRNIQLYEAIFTYIHYHPCYMLKLIETGELNKYQISKFITVIYRNPQLPFFSQSIIMTLTLKTFEFEFTRAVNKMDFIQELKIMKSSSIFYPLYVMYIRSAERENSYFIKFAKKVLQEFFFAKHVVHFTHFPEKIRETKMMHFLNLHYDFSKLEEQKRKLDCLGKIVVEVAKVIIKERDDAKSNGVKLVSAETLYLHNEMIKLVKSTILAYELEKLKKIFKIDDPIGGLEIANKLLKFETHLLTKIENFLIALFYGTLSEYILDEQHKVQEYGAENKLFFKSETNLRTVALVIDKFLQRDPFVEINLHYERLNKVIVERVNVYDPEWKKTQEKQIKKPNNDSMNSQIDSFVGSEQSKVMKSQPSKKQTKLAEQFNLNRIINNAPYLFDDVFFDIENQNIKELIQLSYETTDRYLQIEINDILQLQEFYCSQLWEHGRKRAKDLFVRGAQDPIFIILKQLKFKVHPLKNFSTELLKRRINFKLMPKYGAITIISPLLAEAKRAKITQEKVLQIFKCDVCNVVLGKSLVHAEKEVLIDHFLAKGWKCKDGHYNRLAVLDCEEVGCNNFIEQSALNTMRVLDQYFFWENMDSFYREKDERTDLLAAVVTKIDLYSKDLDFYQHLRTIKSLNKIKKNAKLAGDIEQFIRLLSTREVDPSPGEQDEEENQDGAKREQFNANFRSVREKCLQEMEERSRHRKQQLHYLDFVKQLEVIQNEKQLMLQNLVSMLIDSQSILKGKMKIYANEVQADQDQQLDEDEVVGDAGEGLNIKDKLAFGYFTSLNLFEERVLIKITFQGKFIEKLQRTLKFYFYAQQDGGWLILIVYLQESFWNNFASYIPFIWPNELELSRIHIGIDQYLELKRMAKYRTQITFKNDSVEATFNIRNLIDAMKGLDEKIL